mgnify:CR=1 FL=1
MEKKVSDRAKRDGELVQQALAGSQKAFTELMATYRDNIYFMMLKMVNNPEDADDLTVEAFGKAFKRLEQYRPDFAFSTWLFRIASNNCIDFIRKKKNKQIISLDEAYSDDNKETYSTGIPSEALDPEQRLVKEQRIEQIHRIIEQLKPRYRRLVELRYLQEKSYDEIAQELEMPLGTVKAQLFRSRELMHEILKHSINKI